MKTSSLEIMKHVVQDIEVFVPICMEIPPAKPFPLHYVTLDEDGCRIEVQITIEVIKRMKREPEQ